MERVPLFERFIGSPLALLLEGLLIAVFLRDFVSGVAGWQSALIGVTGCAWHCAWFQQRAHSGWAS